MIQAWDVDPATRGRMAKIEKKTKQYSSDLTDEECERIKPLLPKPEKKAGSRLARSLERDPLHGALLSLQPYLRH